MSQNKINGLPWYLQNVNIVNLRVLGIKVFYFIDFLFYSFKIVRTVLNVKVLNNWHKALFFYKLRPTEQQLKTNIIKCTISNKIVQ